MPVNAPYRPPFQPQADLNLPFQDPNQITPYSPEELQSRQNVMNSGMSLQEALGQQQQAAMPTGIAQNPIFQLAVPTALTVLSAIAPRHMAVAGPLGMAGYRTITDQSNMMNQRRQATVADVAKQRAEDFNRQRFRYIVNSLDIDPSQKTALQQQADVDLPSAEKSFESVANNLKLSKDYNTKVANADPKQWAPGTQKTFTGPGESTTLKSPEPIQPAQPSPFAVEYNAAKEQPGFNPIAFTDEWIKKNKTPSFEQETYDDWKKSHPTGDKAQFVAWKATIVPREKQEMDENDYDMMIDAFKQGLALPPPITARTGISKETRGLTKAALKAGFDLKDAMLDTTAVMKATQTLNSQQMLTERKNIIGVEAMLDHLEGLYARWEKYAPSGFRTLNSAEFASYKQLPGEAGAAAAELEAFMTDTKQALSQVLRGGFAPTDSSERAAQKMMAENMPKEQFRSALNAAKVAAGIRLAAINGIQPIGNQGPVPGFTNPNVPILNQANPNFEPAPAKGGEAPFGTVIEVNGKKHTKTRKGWEPPL